MTIYVHIQNCRARISCCAIIRTVSDYVELVYWCLVLIVCRYSVMLECWRHNAARRPSFIQLLDQLAPSLSEEFRNVSYYFSRQPDDASNVGSTNSRNVSTEDVNDAVTFRAAAAGQPSSTSNSKVSDCDPNDLLLSSFVGHSSSNLKTPQTSEVIRMSDLLNANSSQSSSQSGDQTRGEESHQQSLTQPEAACKKDVAGGVESESKDSSGSSQGSYKNGLVTSHRIPYSIAVPPEVH